MLQLLCFCCTAATSAVFSVCSVAELSALKDDGNQLFRTGYYAEAIQKYDVIIARLENGQSKFDVSSVLFESVLH